MLAEATSVPTAGVGPGASPVLRFVLFLLVVAMSMPDALLAAVMPGHRPYIVPAASLLVVVAWLVLARGAMPAVHGRAGIAWATLLGFLLITFFAAVLHPNALDSLTSFGAYCVRIALAFALIQIFVTYPDLLVRVSRWIWVMLAVVALLMTTGILVHIGGYARAAEVGHLHIKRAAAGFGGPDFAALVYNIGLAFSLVWLAIGRTSAQRAAAAIGSLLLVVGIGRTVSIGGLTGLLVTLVLTGWWVARRSNWRRRRTLVALTTGLILAISGAAGGAYIARIQQQATRSIRSAGAFGSERLNLAIGGARMAAAQPLLGVGLANVADHMPPYLLFPISEPVQGPHNTVLAIADESGIPSVLLVLVAVSLLAALLTSALGTVEGLLPDYWRLLGWGLATAGVAALMQSLALSTQRLSFVWVLGSLVVAWSVITLRARRGRELPAA